MGEGEGEKVAVRDRRQMMVAAIIPAFNESRTIQSIVQSLLEMVDAVIVIDDGSSDDTCALATAAGATVVRHEQNLGYAGAIMTGFRCGMERNADVLVLIDGDGQHRCEDIPGLLAPIFDGAADVVIGTRFGSIPNPTPFYRTIGQRVLNWATYLGSGIYCSDSQCGFRAFNRRAFSSIQLHETFMHGMAGGSETQFEIARHRLRLKEVPVYVRYDEEPRRSPVKHGFGVLYRVVAMSLGRRGRPLHDRLAGLSVASTRRR